MKRRLLKISTLALTGACLFGLTGCAKEAKTEDVLFRIENYYASALYLSGGYTCSQVRVSGPTAETCASLKSRLASVGYVEGRYTEIPKNDVNNYRLNKFWAESMAKRPGTRFLFDGRSIIMISKSSLLPDFDIDFAETFDDNGYQAKTALYGVNLSDASVTFEVTLNFEWEK